MMYPLVSELAADQIPVAVSLRVLKLARQPYYRWLANPVTDQEWDEAHRLNALIDSDTSLKDGRVVLRAGETAGTARLVLSPIARFLRFYVVKLGFLDGVAGFAHVAIGAFANGSSRYATAVGAQANAGWAYATALGSSGDRPAALAELAEADSNLPQALRALVKRLAEAAAQFV
ncbi:hypothetical protein [Dermacoccus nishinomiyaensis]|uniref:hypothetical protein n=1 Tax=Dermacoccus nishinomiyaensis TaxID=1274 RepID=UPI00248E96D4|nr:hypothetical protein [Dermacoccus nishinomiyaensis]